MRLSKIFSIAILGVVLLQSGILLFLSQLQIYRLHIENWNEVKSGNIIEISISENEYEKGRVNQNEIIIENKIYDIKKTQFAEGRVLLCLVADDAEDSVRDTFANYFSNVGKSMNTSGGSPFSIFFSLNFFQNSSVVYFQNSSICLQLCYTNCFSDNRGIPGIQTPPPEL